MPAPSTSLRRLLGALGDFVFPPLCYGCDEETEGGLVCDSCRVLLFTSELAVCPGCGRPCATAGTGCGRCRVPFHLGRVRALGPYQPPFNKLVHAFKYSEKTRVGELLGRALAALVAQDPVLAACDAVCAVPLHAARLRDRGYNQSLLLAGAIALATGMPLVDPLVRRRNTPSQTAKMTAEAREENLRGAFALREDPGVAGKRLLLVDDVMTTGATLDQAAQELLRGGASGVLGAVIAAAPGHHAVA